MTFRVISGKNVTFLIHNGEINDTLGLAGEVRRALRVCRREPWNGMYLHVFEGRGESLVIAFPCGNGKISGNN